MFVQPRHSLRLVISVRDGVSENRANNIWNENGPGPPSKSQSTPLVYEIGLWSANGNIERTGLVLQVGTGGGCPNLA